MVVQLDHGTNQDERRSAGDSHLLESGSRVGTLHGAPDPGSGSTQGLFTAVGELLLPRGKGQRSRDFTHQARSHQRGGFFPAGCKDVRDLRARAEGSPGISDDPCATALRSVISAILSLEWTYNVSPHNSWFRCYRSIAALDHSVHLRRGEGNLVLHGNRSLSECTLPVRHHCHRSCSHLPGHLPWVSPADELDLGEVKSLS